jgi:uncharacterized protein YbjT (DUF2867 family)
MADEKLIVVAGATGAQGGGLVRAILAKPELGFRVRALTRNAASDKAQALAAAGAEVVEADISDAESTRKAFAGAYGAYCVTFFWEHMSPDLEIQQATNMAKAAESAGLRHVIWSTLEDSRKWIPLDDNRMPTLMERYKVPHFDAKAEADAAFHESAVPVTYLLTSFYWDNFIHFGMGPAKQADGVRAITFPMGDRKLPGIAAEDIGKCALGIFCDAGEWAGQRVGIASEHMTGQDMADGLAKAIGEPVAYNDVPPDVYRGFGFPGADDIGNMFQFNRDFSDVFCAARDVEVSRSLNPEMQSFADWAAAHADKLR